jgi:hypothetical protein
MFYIEALLTVWAGVLVGLGGIAIAHLYGIMRGPK